MVNARTRVHRRAAVVGLGALLAIVSACEPEPEPSAPQSPAASGRESSAGVSRELGVVSGSLTVGGYSCPQCCTCKDLTLQNIPGDNVYYVTTFTGGGMACGKKASGDWAYIAGTQRWGCGARVAVKNPANGKQCITEVADCGPNKCVEQAAGKAIIDASPFITKYLFGITSSGWSEHRKVVATKVSSSTPLGCPGGTPPPPAPTLPVMTIASKTAAKDTRPEGKSKDIGDVFEGDTFTVDVLVTNKASGAATKGHVHVGYWVEEPWLTPVTYTIYTDWPKKDQKTWKVNDSDKEATNPSKTSPPKTGKIDIYGMSPGETKKITFKLKAAKYSIGAVDHPDLRAWVWHVANYYGEQTGYYDKVETNKAGKELKTYKQHDVYGKTHWEWNGTEPETEGWAKKTAITTLKVNTSVGALAIQQGGADPHLVSPAVSLDASKWKGLKLRARQYEGTKKSQIFWTTADDTSFSESKSAWFETPGDGEFHDVVVNCAAVSTWKGTITKLRLDPTVSSTGWYDVDWLKAVTDPGATSGDADGDGVLGSEDCDDTAPLVHPGAPEVCNGADDDCDGAVDEDFGLGATCTVGVGACEATGHVGCAADGSPSCDAVSAAPSEEACDAVDNDCDGQTDEDFDLPCPTGSDQGGGGEGEGGTGEGAGEGGGSSGDAEGRGPEGWGAEAGGGAGGDPDVPSWGSGAGGGPPEAPSWGPLDFDAQGFGVGVSVGAHDAGFLAAPEGITPQDPRGVAGGSGCGVAPSGGRGAVVTWLLALLTLAAARRPRGRQVRRG